MQHRVRDGERKIELKKSISASASARPWKEGHEEGKEGDAV